MTVPPNPFPHAVPLPDRLVVRGAREHNLRGVDLDLPHRTLTVFTGVSGSGKSSLAFATIYAEGQRRSLQSLSSFARQFVDQLDKPDLDHISGLCAAVAIDQSSAANRSPRSTVGTSSDVNDTLRVLFARAGRAHCTECDTALTTDPERGQVCPKGHDTQVPEMLARSFSFNIPIGQCPDCLGIGTKLAADPELLVPDPGLSLDEGAFACWRPPVADRYRLAAAAVAVAAGERSDTPWRELSAKLRDTLLYGVDVKVKEGSGGAAREVRYTGAVPWIEDRHRTAPTERKAPLAAFLRPVACPGCGGKRLAKAQLAVRMGGLGIADVCAMSVREAAAFLRALELEEEDRLVVAQALQETIERLDFLDEVGLGYLSLERASRTLSGGEAQRIRLAGLLGSGMFGRIYVLDEPSAGLHPRDTEDLVGTLRALRDQGNTVVVVEHDHQVIRAADWIVELGPGAGELGGEVTFTGTVPTLVADPASLTGGYVSGQRGIPVPEQRRAPRPGHAITIHGAREHNLRGIDVAFPLGCFTAVTGVSGAGKSTLVNHILFRAADRALGGTAEPPGAHDRIEGLGAVDRVIRVDQAPIGRNGRSTPATYTGILDQVRKLFAQTDEAKRRRYTSGRFSFNSAGGRCETCQGEGSIRIEMAVLSDVVVTCDTCHGRRFDAETLEIRYRDLNIADVLDLTVEQAKEFFAGVPAVVRALEVLCDVGLGYLRLGQSATTLSGGEAQRVKLAVELQRKGGSHTLYLLDEPTTGLHTHDIERLLTVLHSLVDKGHTVITVTHSLEVTKTADWVIDIGPEAGDGGGQLTGAGTPEAIAATDSHTSRFLREVLPG